MLFNSLTFLAFFALFIVPYFLLRGTARTALILAASYVFYGWWDWRFLALIAGTTTLDWAVAPLLAASEGRRRRTLLILNVGIHLAALGFFKYYGFFTESFRNLLGTFGVEASMPMLHVVLPVGISFYTFQSLSYVVDVYRGHIEVERSWLRYAAYVAFFPQLVAGPIERAGNLLPQFRSDHAFSHDKFVSGFRLAMWGFVKKVVVADSLGALVDVRFVSPGMHTPLDLWLGLYFYAFQIYCDFSGYSDIARGTARILGFDLMVNFDRPYFAASFREFWSRWHISLSTWLRDYLYIPLGGNRGGVSRALRNLMLTMLLGGLWHGAKWTFVFWGFLHGLYLILERLFGEKLSMAARALSVPPRLRTWLAMAVVFHLACFAWLFFRARSFGDALDYLRAMLAWDGAPLRVTLAILTAKALGLCAALVAVEALSFRWDAEAWLAKRPMAGYLALAAGIWCILLLGNFSAQRFIYFQF